MDFSKLPFTSPLNKMPQYSFEMLHNAILWLRQGNLVAFPTETVYGLGADAENDQAVASIFETKKRPHFNPLILHASDLFMARQYAKFDERAIILAANFWPGPLTLILAKRLGTKLSNLVTAGLETVAIRVPDHPLAIDLIRLLGRPLAAPSANVSGKLSSTTSLHVMASFKNNPNVLVFDGEDCRIGLESTILDLTSNVATILRPGAIPIERIEEVLKQEVLFLKDIKKGKKSPPTSPGLLARHYAPKLPLRLNATTVSPNEALLAFGKNFPHGAARTLNLSTKGSLMEAAANFFKMLHELDQVKQDYSTIAVSPIPEEGLGIAINDRLKRAASQ